MISAPSRTVRVWILLALTPLMPWLGLLPGGRWWMPLAAPLTVYAALLNRVRLRDLIGAWRLGVVWGALLSAGVLALTTLRPEAAAGALVHGEPHREAMFQWIATGEGPEGDPSVFLLRHLFELAVFLVLSWASAGYLGWVGITVLLSSMGYFAASYAEVSGSPWLGLVVAWVPWSVLRVLALMLLGILLARPLLLRRPWPFEGRRERLLLAVAASGILGDLLIQIFLAPGYGLALRHLAGGLIR